MGHPMIVEPIALRDEARILAGEDAGAFRSMFDCRPFALRHNIQPSHPLFDFGRIRKLARFLQTQECPVHYDAGDIKIAQRWNQVPPRKLSFDEALDQMDRAGAWIFVRQIERDPEYRELLNQIMSEVSELSGRDIAREQKVMEGIVFVTSPNRITSYHIDRECSLLLQVSGDKRISVFNRDDREVLTEPELESFWAADNNAAIYREQFQDRADVFQLTPGSGVHIPVNCPHWLRNGNQVSISLNVNYQFKDSQRKYIYQSNFYLRKLGLHPIPPGQSPWRDRTKNTVMGAMVKCSRFLRRGFKPESPSSYAS